MLSTGCVITLYFKLYPKKYISLVNMLNNTRLNLVNIKNKYEQMSCGLLEVKLNSSNSNVKCKINVPWYRN